MQTGVARYGKYRQKNTDSGQKSWWLNKLYALALWV